MSFKAKIAAAAATFALAGGGLGTAGALSASAATAVSGSHFQYVYTLQFGPRYVLDTFQGRAAAGQEVILFQASSSDPAEDFVIKYLGKVGSLYTTGKHSLFTPQFKARYGSFQAFEFQYEPHGVNSHLCTATWPGVSARAGFKVRLEPCGLNNSIWVAGPVSHHGMATRDVVRPGSTFLINGATDSVSHPLVLTYPAGNPTDRPRPWLNVQPLHAYANGTVFDNQQWSALPGPVHGGM
jgi:hypothetical protein